MPKAVIRVSTALLGGLALHAAVPTKAQDAADSAKVEISFDLRIPLRDGTSLSATLYRPKGQTVPATCVATLTPYIADYFHNRGVYFAARGFPFLIANVRGRGTSDGSFRPFLPDGADGRDMVEWLARQPWCRGKVGLWGGSYGGYTQWATAGKLPPSLGTIVPVAGPWFGAEVPGRGNIGLNYMLQWLHYTGGRTLQPNLFSDWGFWSSLWLDRFRKGEPFLSLETAMGTPFPLLREWAEHPRIDAYWDAYNPSAEALAKLDIPILTITGSHDDDQPGALAAYRAHLAAASPNARANHYLVIGPWDHAGTRTPKRAFGGIEVGPASLVDLPALHVDWYRHALERGARPAFLAQRVSWYVMGADVWRRADTLEQATRRTQPFHLTSTGRANRLETAGQLSVAPPRTQGQDSYVHDPRDVSLGDLEAQVDPSSLTDQRLVLARDGGQLVYLSAPFEKPTEITGFFRLKAWLSIDQPDTDFQVIVHEVRPDGTAIQLSSDYQRARHRNGNRTEELITTQKPLLYDFKHFTFVSRQLQAGSRLRLVVAPVNSILLEKNYNAAKPVALQSMGDAQPVTVRLHHGKENPSILIAPFG